MIVIGYEEGFFKEDGYRRFCEKIVIFELRFV